MGKGHRIMKSAHVRQAFFFCALPVSFAALAIETSAQSRSSPARQLSDAVAEVLRSPFHGHRALHGLGGPGRLLPTVGFPNAGEGRATLWSTGRPNAEPPPAEVASPPNRPFGLTVFAAIGSHVATALFLRCQDPPYEDRGRYTGSGRPGVIGFPSSEGESLCPSVKTNSNLVQDGFLLLVPTMTTAGAATVSGSGLLRAVGGSALGFVGSLLFYKGMTGLTNVDSIEDLPIPMWFMGGFMHGVVTAYLSG